MMQAQTWKSTPFTIERKEGKAPGTVIFRLRGPFTARDMFGTLAPVALDNMLSFPTWIPPAWAGSFVTMSTSGVKASG